MVACRPHNRKCNETSCREFTKISVSHTIHAAHEISNFPQPRTAYTLSHSQIGGIEHLIGTLFRLSHTCFSRFFHIRLADTTQSHHQITYGDGMDTTPTTNRRFFVVAATPFPHRKTQYQQTIE